MPHRHPDEQVIRRFDHHWIRFVTPVVTFLITTTILTVIGVFAVTQSWSGANIILLIVGAIFLCTVHTLFRFLFSEALEVGYITQYRLVHFEQRILIKDDILEVGFDPTKNVIGTKHGLLQNLLGYGDLTFTTMGTTIHTIPRPDRIAELIQELTDKA